jgi:hypothetical protein
MIKLFSVTLSILMLVFLSYVGGQRVGHAAGKTHGVLEGCQQLLDVVASEDFEPKCMYVEGELAINVTNPNSGESYTEILSTGEVK